MNLEKLLLELNFINVVEEAVKNEIYSNENQIKEISRTAYDGEDYNFSLCSYAPLTCLASVTFMLLQKYDDYKTNGVSNNIIYDTFRDVSLRANRYYERTGNIGITKDDVIWFRHIKNVAIFKIGTLQYQPFEMIYLDEKTIGEQYMTFREQQKITLPKGAPVINCHIQHGANLCSEAVDKSLKMAKRFFKNYSPTVQYKVFLCYSWMLYPPMNAILNGSSNIKQFSSRFNVIGYCNDSEQAIENLFEDGKVILLSYSTKLQKMAVEHIELFGYACGVIEI